MRCPACQHISTAETGPCPNCGFTSASTSQGPAVALDLASADEPLGPLDDFPLADPMSVPIDRTAAPAAGRSASKAVRTGLPLFPQSGLLAPLRPSASRPLSVRRQTPVIPKLKTSSVRRTPTTGSLQFDERVTGEEFSVAPVTTVDVFRLFGRRVIAGLVDGALLVGVDLAVLYLTLRLTGLSVAMLSLLPPGPLVVFLLLIDLGYVVVLTACGGQTIGKMTLGLRVERADGTSAGLAQAVKRTAALAVSLLPVGLGFVGLFVGRRRALHDRLADTRVVRIV